MTDRNRILMTMRCSVYRLLVATLVLINLVTGANAEEFTFDYQKIVEVSAPVELSLHSIKGDVIITGGSDNRVVIEAVKRVRGSNRNEAEEVADHIEIKVRSGEDKVDIETNYLKMVNRGRSFWSKIFGSGGTDSYGAVDFRISVPTRTSVSAICLNGDIEISSVEGELILENSSGSTRGEYLFGPISLMQPAGDIDLNWIEGDIKLKSTSSRISIIQVRGSIDLTTAAGTVNVQTELDSPKEYFVETTSGSITFGIPASSSGRLSIETGGGVIRSEVPVTIQSISRKHLSGIIGEGGPKISLSSGTGNVDVVLY